jgi:hypothetical protein
MDGQNLGIKEGMSFVENWDNDINQLYQREEYKARINNEQEKKAEYYANLLKQGHVSSPYAESRLQEFYKGLNGKVADFAINNPNFTNDVTGMQKFNELTDQFLNNPIILEDQQVKHEFQKFQDAVVAGNISPDTYHENMERYNNYINAKPGDNVSPYVFQNFKQQDFDKMTSEIAGTIKTDQFENVKQVGYDYYKTTDVDKLYPVLLSRSMAAVQDPEKAIAINNRYQAAISSNPDLKNLKGFENSVTWYANYLQSALPIKNMEHAWSMSEWMSGQGEGANVDWFGVSKLPRILSLYNAIGQKKNADGSVALDSNQRPIVGYTDQEISADPEDIALTDFDKDKRMSINGAAGVLVKNTKTGQLEPFSFAGTSVIAGCNSIDKIVSISGIPYAKVNVSYGSPIGTEGINKDKPFYPAKDEWGFQTMKTQIPAGSMSALNMTGSMSVGTGQQYSGDVYVRLKVNQNTAQNWNKLHNGESYANKVSTRTVEDLQEMAKANPASSYAINKIASGDIPNISGVMPAITGNNIAKRNKYLIAEQTDPTSGKKIDILIDAETGIVWKDPATVNKYR